MKKKFLFFATLLTLSLTMVACGSKNISSSVPDDVLNGNEEISQTTEQIENTNTESSVDSATPEATPTEEPTSTPTPEEPTDVPESEPTETPSPTPTETPEPTPTETPAPTPTETPTPTPGEKEDEKKEPSSGSENVPPVEEEPIPTPTPTPNPTPSTPSGWNGNYDSPLSEGFDHIKIPTRDDFYSEGLTMNDDAFDFNGSDWSNAWWDSYQDFLVANGSPINDNGQVMGAFYAIHDGYNDGYQYLYYGFSQGATNGWGDIALFPNGMVSTYDDIFKHEDFKDAYFLELSNFTYGNMDKMVEDEYRAATTMLLSWICPNPSQVEKVIYDAIDANNHNSALVNHIVQNGWRTWYQVGEVDILVTHSNPSKEICQVAIRKHDDSKSMTF